MNSPEPDFPDSRRLLRLAEPGAAVERIWSKHELGEILAHQLAAPICVDLQQLDNLRALQAAQLADAANPPIRSFADLFAHENPPLELLRLVKAFAQAQLHAPEPLLPKPIALTLYDGAILAALVRCGERITDLPDRNLAEGTAWLVGEPWMDRTLGRFLRDAAGTLPQP